MESRVTNHVIFGCAGGTSCEESALLRFETLLDWNTFRTRSSFPHEAPWFEKGLRPPKAFKQELSFSGSIPRNGI